jgi:hypothetical protein
MHTDGSWVYTADTSIKIIYSQMDEASERPINNDEPKGRFLRETGLMAHTSHSKNSTWL